MLIYNNWVSSNFLDIARNKTNVFKVSFHPYKFRVMPFHLAAKVTAALIRYQYLNMPLYLGLTGGSDSEYIARLFKELDFKFTPIIVQSGVNEQDVNSALLLCEELALRPIVIKCTQDDLMSYYKDVVFPANSEGLIHVHQLMVVDKVTQLNGICILGETHIFDPDPSRSLVRAIKFLPDLRGYDVIPFYYYTLELTYAEMQEVRSGESAPEYKARVRGTKYRQKIYPKYDRHILQEFHNLTNLLHPSLLIDDMGTPQHFIDQMEPFIQ